MIIESRKTFDTIAQRVLYGLNFMYSEFVPVESEIADERAQYKLHILMGRLIDRLYDAPDLLGLAGDADRAYEWYVTNNSDTELDAIYKSIFKELYDFYKLLYIAFLHGEAGAGNLSVCSKVLKENKASCRPLYKALLCEVGIGVEKTKTECVFTADDDIIQGFVFLARCIPVKLNPWTPYALMNFTCCSFTGDFDYLLAKVDAAAGLNGLLFEIESRCIAEKYKKGIKCAFGTSGFDFAITYRNAIGGFVVGYNPRKRWQFYFGSLNSIGVKAMLEDFGELGSGLQRHFINTCKTCNGCLGCTKGGKNKVFATCVEFEGRTYNLCNDNYARHDWESIDRGLASVLFEYHAAQEIYGVDWNRKTPN